jgi:hypothetical protein
MRCSPKFACYLEDPVYETARKAVHRKSTHCYNIDLAMDDFDELVVRVISVN